MIATSTVISCSMAELAYLTALCGAGPLAGVPDPFFGWLAHEVAEALAGARDSLARRGLILIHEDGRIEAAAQIGPIMMTATRPDVSFRLTRTVAGAGTSFHHFHATSELAVELAMGAGGGQVDLLALTDPEAISRRVVHLFGLHDQAVPTVSGGGAVPEAILRRALELAEDGGMPDAAILLGQSGLAADTAAELAATLAGLACNGALVALTRPAQGIGLLAGEGGLWLLHPEQRGEQPWVKVEPAGAEGARTALHALVHSGLARIGSK